MILNDVHQGVQKHRQRKRIGRGVGSGTGKTAGKGHKGYFARAGSPRRLGFEGGQVTLLRRIAKRGFNNKEFATTYLIVNVGCLDKAFEAGEVVTPETLSQKGLAKGPCDGVKILGNGTLTKSLTVQAHAFSKSAEEKIVANGGTFTRL